MKTLLMCTALVFASASAQAQNSFSFDINGKRVHIAVPKHCDDEFCLSVHTDRDGPGMAIKGRQGLRDALSKFLNKGGADQDDDEDKTDPNEEKAPPKRATVAEPKVVPAPIVPAAPVATTEVRPVAPPVAQTEPRPVAAIESPPAAPPVGAAEQPAALFAPPAVTEESSRSLTVAPAVPVVAPKPVAPPTAVVDAKPIAPPVAAVESKPIAPAAPTVAPVEAKPIAPQVATVEATPAQEPSPVGIWVTEKKEGKVHIVPCGENLCGYVVDSKTNTDGEKVLIDMKPVTAKKWAGQIHKPKGGGTYDATIALKGPDSLRVQGCAFGGMFCGGQTWSRV